MVLGSGQPMTLPDDSKSRKSPEETDIVDLLPI